MEKYYDHTNSALIRKFCGCMALRSGSALACTFWLAINVYVATLAFQSRNPIFSYLNDVLLSITGAICLCFSVVALYSLYSLYMDYPMYLFYAHRATLLIVMCFLVDFLIAIIFFGAQEEAFNDWCITATNQLHDEPIFIPGPNSTLVSVATNLNAPQSLQVYNCQRLWQSELKLAIALFAMLLISYIYWGICLWSYSQKVHVVSLLEARAEMAVDPPLETIVDAPPGAPVAVLGQNGVLNLKPSAEPPLEIDDGGQSAAQIARKYFKRFKSTVRHIYNQW